MKEKISVIVAAYNVKEYIGRCLESLLSQNYRNYEIVVVDDGSTDGTGEIIDGYFQQNAEKIRLIRQDNSGLSVARNVGLAVASGELVTFVDGDDYLEKNALSTLYFEIKRSGADIAIAGFYEDFCDFSKEINFKGEEISFEQIMEYISAPDGYKFVVVWGKLYRKSLFSGVEFPPGKLHEDQYTIHKLYYYSKKTVSVGKRIYHHIRREGSISTRPGFSHHTDDIDALFSRSEFLYEKGLASCLVYVARHMLRLIDFYLGESPAILDNREKCLYIKRIIGFVRENFGKSSDIYRRCISLYLKRYIKYRLYSYVWG